MTDNQRNQLILIMGFCAGLKHWLKPEQCRDIDDFVITPLEKITGYKYPFKKTLTVAAEPGDSK